jgi:hypothetical protein
MYFIVGKNYIRKEIKVTFALGTQCSYGFQHILSPELAEIEIFITTLNLAVMCGCEA